MVPMAKWKRNQAKEPRGSLGGAMFRQDRWIPALLLTALFAMQVTLSEAATQIGVAASIKPNADRVVGAKAETLTPGSELYANETVRTGNLGRADLVFVDKTNLTVGPASEVRLDKFVYDPSGSSGQVVMQMSRGAFRFVTGTQEHRVYKVSTPYGDAWRARHSRRNGDSTQTKQKRSSGQVRCKGQVGRRPGDIPHLVREACGANRAEPGHMRFRSWRRVAFDKFRINSHF